MLLARFSFVLAGALLVLIDLHLKRRRGRGRSLAFTGLVAWSVASILCVILLWASHLRFPFHLDLMEGVVWQRGCAVLHSSSHAVFLTSHLR